MLGFFLLLLSLYDVLSLINIIYKYFFFLHACFKPDVIHGLSFMIFLKRIFCIGQFSL